MLFNMYFFFLKQNENVEEIWKTQHFIDIYIYISGKYLKISVHGSYMRPTMQLKMICFLFLFKS